MSKPSDRRHPDRRAFLRSLAQAAAIAGGSVVASRALAQDATLQALIDQNLRSDFGQGFDSASRTIRMPTASMPTLSAATVEHTEQAIHAFEGIVARGGWPEVGNAERVRLGVRHPVVAALRKRLADPGHQRFVAHAGATPEHVALAFGSQEISYAELDRRSNAVARALEIWRSINLKNLEENIFISGRGNT